MTPFDILPNFPFAINKSSFNNSNKHSIRGLLHELTKTHDLSKLGNINKTSEDHRIIAY